MNSKNQMLSYSWSTLSKFGQSRLVRSNYIWLAITPIFAKALQRAPSSIVLMGIEFQLTLPFSWIAFYFSAIFFSVGTILYSLFSPPLIKQFKNFSDFEAKGFTKKQLLVYISNWMREGGKIITAEGNIVPHIEEAHRLESHYCDLNPDLGNANSGSYRVKHLNLRDEMVAEAYWRGCQIMNKDRPIIRRLVMILYFCGTIFLSIIIIQNLTFVFNVAVDKYL